jgi:lysophospholipase L1-like esterase/pimeloyl-ACP methyl ester carboxylesterase
MSICHHPLALLKFIPVFALLSVAVATLAAATLAAAGPVEELGAPQDVPFTSTLDGTEQRYVIRLPKQFAANQSQRLMIALHGHGSDRWQFTNDTRDECRAARDAASRHGIIYVSPDYRAKTSWMGPAAEADLLQILDDLQQQYRIENIIICGGSMGGTSALAFAAMHPGHVDGVVSLNGTANLVEYAGFSDAIAESYGGTRAEKPDVYRQRSAELFPERLTMPVGLTTGGQDTLVPPDSVLRLASVLKKRDATVHLNHRPEGGHNTTYADSMEALDFVIEKSVPPLIDKKPLLTFGQEPRTIVSLGDSVTGVYYHTGGRRAYPEMLEVGLRQLFPGAPITVINAGISGQTTANGLERLDRDVLDKHPDLVTISFGLNDMTRIPPETYHTNLITLITRCREAKSQVVLCTPNAVIDTAARPIEKLKTFCDILRAVGREMSVPVCDQYQAGEHLRARAPWAWRLTLSDEIHPNMDGHKRMAEELCRTIAARSISLQPVTPPRPSLPHLKVILKQKRPVKVLAMPPYDAQIEIALRELDNSVTVEVLPWPVEGASMAVMEQAAKSLARNLKPDLVVLAVPRDAAADSDEHFVHTYSWIMNSSLSFGQQEWDCIVVHPSVAAPDMVGQRDALSRQLARAQDLDVIDRAPDDKSAGPALFKEWFRQRANE